MTGHTGPKGPLAADPLSRRGRGPVADDVARSEGDSTAAERAPASPDHDYALFLDLRGRRVLVAGGGPVGTRRAMALADSGAVVTVVSPWATEDLRDAGAAGRIVWHQRDLDADDLEDVWLVHACTGDSAVDEQIVAMAEERRIWSVRASAAAASPAWTGTTTSTVDGVHLAVSGGRDPGRAKALRDRIADLAAEGQLPVRRRRRVRGCVYLVGGGPGDPDLLTVRARRLLSLADVIVTDRLAPVAILAELGLTAALAQPVEVIDVGKAPGRHAMPQEQISQLLVDRAAEGKVVVRFKGGDPFVFGRGGEEALACAEAGIPVEVVPGVTSAISVPAAAGIPLTHRGLSASALILSAHDGPGEVVRRAAATPEDTTLVLLMGMRHLAETAEGLVRAGRPADLPAAVVANGWTRDQRVVTATLSTIAATAAVEGVGAPAVVVIGAVAGLHQSLGHLGRVSPEARHGAVA